MKTFILTIAATVVLATSVAAANAQCAQASRFPAGETGPTFPDQASDVVGPSIHVCTLVTVRERFAAAAIIGAASRAPQTR